MSSELVYFNGILADTGEYLTPPMTWDEAAEVALGRRLDGRLVEEHRIWLDEALRGRAIRDGDSSDLGEAGWGILFAASESKEKVDAILEALSPLVEHRKMQALRKGDERYFRIYRGDSGYRAGESRHAFLVRHEASPCGPAEPEKMPYYLLIVGDPAAIPYEFQYQLDVQYAVGRIWFETIEGYHYYARSVVAAEIAKNRSNRRAVFFGPRHASDPPTDLSVDQLTLPLAKWAGEKCPSWRVETIVGPEATKSRLKELMGGTETPDFLFTASHGVGYVAGDRRQRRRQGAFLCQDWPGPGQPVQLEHMFAAEDVDGAAQLGGMVAFHFACDSAGTPSHNDLDLETRRQLAEQAFIAELPARLLSHPNGGALAVIGHVGGANKESFAWPGAGKQLQAFEDAVKRLLSGCPVGYAMEPFNVRHADLSVSLSDLLQDLEWGLPPDKAQLASMWATRNDARNYVVVGDPAVRLSPPS